MCFWTSICHVLCCSVFEHPRWYVLCSSVFEHPSCHVLWSSVFEHPTVMFCVPLYLNIQRPGFVFLWHLHWDHNLPHLNLHHTLLYFHIHHTLLHLTGLLQQHPQAHLTYTHLTSFLQQNHAHHSCPCCLTIIVKNVSKKMISLGIKGHSLQPLLKMSNMGEGNTKSPRPGKVIEFLNITIFVIIC